MIEFPDKSVKMYDLVIDGNVIHKRDEVVANSVKFLCLQDGGGMVAKRWVTGLVAFELCLGVTGWSAEKKGVRMPDHVTEQ